MSSDHDHDKRPRPSRPGQRARILHQEHVGDVATGGDVLSVDVLDFEDRDTRDGKLRLVRTRIGARIGALSMKFGPRHLARLIALLEEARRAAGWADEAEHGERAERAPKANPAQPRRAYEPVRRPGQARGRTCP